MVFKDHTLTQYPNRHLDLYPYLCIMDLFDTHCHLTDLYKNSTEYKEVLNRALENGVKAVVIIGTGIEDLKKAFTLSEELEGSLITGVAGGFTPFDIQHAELEQIDALSDLLAENSRTVAVGEIGLDRHHSYSDEKTEELFFEKQLELAADLNFPVVIHCRKAHERMRVILKSYASQLNRKGVIHCFSGTYEDGADYLDMGFSLSFTCALGYKNARDQRETVGKVPLSHILAETDSPYLPPASLRGSRNEPAHVREVVRLIAEIKDLKEDQTAETIFCNSCRLFGIST